MTMNDAVSMGEAWAALADSTTAQLFDLERPRAHHDNPKRLVDVKKSPSALSRSVAKETTKEKKRRVRRIHLELPYFRQQVRELETKLKQLKTQQSPTPSSEQSLSPANETTSPRCLRDICLVDHKKDRQTGTTVWEGIAERQLTERVHAEQQNEILKGSNGELTKLSLELRNLLQKRVSNEELAERMGRNAVKKFWDFSSEDDAVIFAEQLASVVNTHLRLEHAPQIPRIAMQLSPNLSGGKERLILNPNIAGGVMFELHCGTTVPFTLEVAAQAYWKLFAFGPGRRAHQHDTTAQAPEDATGDVVARTFALQTDYEGYTSQFRGKVTCRKYVSEDSVTVVWEGAGDVLEMSGVKFHGVQSHKTGWVKLRRVARQGPGQVSTSTTVEMYFETTPVFHESVTDLREQTQTLIDAIDKGQGKVNKLFCQIVGGMLVEEDWKATYGNEMLGA